MFNHSQPHFASDSQPLLSFKAGSAPSVTQALDSPARFLIYCNEAKPTTIFFSFTAISKDNSPRKIINIVFQIKRDFSVYTYDGMSKGSGRKRISFQKEYQYGRTTGPSGRCGAGERTRSQVICCRTTPTSFMVMAAISVPSASTQHQAG